MLIYTDISPSVIICFLPTARPPVWLWLARSVSTLVTTSRAKASVECPATVEPRVEHHAIAAGPQVHAVPPDRAIYGLASTLHPTQTTATEGQSNWTRSARIGQVRANTGLDDTEAPAAVPLRCLLRLVLCAEYGKDIFFRNVRHRHTTQNIAVVSEGVA
jgi:hypothetical protein